MGKSFKELSQSEQVQFVNDSNLLFFRTMFYGEEVQTNSGMWKLWSLNSDDYDYNVYARFRIEKDGRRTQELLVNDVLHKVEKINPLLWGLNSNQSNIYDAPIDIVPYQDAYKISIGRSLIEYHKAEGFYDE